MRDKAWLFGTAFLQVLLVTAQTYFIEQTSYVLVPILAFAISYIWSHNIRKISIGGELDSITYGLGAAAGSVTGMFLAKLIYK
jgi:hypothetical protein